MRNCNSIVLSLAFIVAAAVSNPSHSSTANLIDATHGVGAGSFELGTFVNNGNDFLRVLAGDTTTITGWSVGGPGDGVDWLIGPDRFNADDGDYGIDLQGGSPSSISTTIPTLLGQEYILKFSAATSMRLPFITGSEGMVSAGSLQDQKFSVAFSDSSTSLEYEFFSYAFTAEGTSTDITFEGLDPITDDDNAFSFGPAIDNVSVHPVPLPLSLWLFGSGIILLGSKLRRSKTI